MKLKKIEIQGFKSFPNKTEIRIQEGITAIVGPNGSGKSNISDAIRWVLGEQSVRNLRGNRMEDVIFSGTSKRKALGFAEVTISFDNKSKLIPIDYSEVAITRRMFRSGESEYYINKSSCRLKDIRELFMDTGVGKDGYSIIGQGRIDEILSNRPEDRRSIFEEAAGIVKYKARKEEAERKLERTEGNLLRIKDLIFELTNQLELLDNQSKKANNFTKLYNRLRELEISLFVKEVDRISQTIEEAEKEGEETRLTIEKFSGEKDKTEETFSLLRSNLESIEEEMEACRSISLELAKDLDKNKNELALLLEREKYIQKDTDRLGEENKELLLKMTDENKENHRINEEIDLLEDNYHILLENYDKKKLDLEETLQAFESEEELIDKEKDRIIEIFNKISEKKSELNSIVSFNENIQERINYLEREFDALKKEKSIIEESNLQSINLEEKLIEDLTKLKKNLGAFREDEKKNTKILDSMLEEFNSNNMQLQGKLSSLKLLEGMESDYDGYFRGVKSILKAADKDLSIRQSLVGVLADLIRVEKKYEKAIEISLGSNIQNIVTGTEEDAKKLIAYLKRNNQGRITCLPISVIKGKPLNISKEDRQEFKVLGLGHELVHYDEKYDNIIKSLLGRTIIVENIDWGIKLANKYKHSLRIVTLDGEVLNPGGSLTGGSYSISSNSLIGRKNQIENLSLDIGRLKEIQLNLANKTDHHRKGLLVLRETIQDKEKSLEILKYETMDLASKKEKELTEINRINHQIDRSEKDLSNLKEELINYKVRQEELINKISQLELEGEERREYVKQLVQLNKEEKEFNEKKSKALTDLSLEKNSLESKINHLKDKHASNLKEIEAMEKLILEKKTLIGENGDEIDRMTETMEDLNLIVKRLELTSIDNGNKLRTLTKTKEKIMVNFYDEQDNLKNINHLISSKEKDLNNLEVKLAKINVQLDNYHKKIKDDYELDYKEALIHKIEIKNTQDAIIESRRLKVQIKELGSVNLSSIEEYKNLKERLDFILNQEKDLLNGKENLKEVIKDMEAKMTKQFLVNFQIINDNFKETFKILFNGGQAELIIEDKDDILNSGIDIQVQPPGKTLQSLSLLSGGEKSLTAVALLFAILQSKPSPFCILDEIDAALDEANISRYTNYLKSFCNQTQFILITHRKTTMEIADILYGVAMEEEGISSLISVKLQDYIDEMAS